MFLLHMTFLFCNVLFSAGLSQKISNGKSVQEEKILCNDHQKCRKHLLHKKTFVTKDKGAKRNCTFQNSSNIITFLSYCQFLVAWTSCPRTAKGRSPDLSFKRIRLPSRFPSGNESSLTKYGDELVQDSHLFSFSPVQLLLTDTLHILFNFLSVI